MTERVVVITGATGVLGRQAAGAFAARGDRLALLSREQAHLDAVVKELDLPPGRVMTCAVDLAEPGSVRAAAEAVEASVGPAHILLHLVGGWAGGKTLAETPAQDFDAMFRQHAETTFHLFQAFVPQLIKNHWGRAVMVSAPPASRPVAKRGVYAAAKAAQEALFLTLADEIKDQGGTSNIIVVSSIDVDAKGTGTPPRQIVAGMLYLCSDEAARVNGTRLMMP